MYYRIEEYYSKIVVYKTGLVKDYTSKRKRTVICSANSTRVELINHNSNRV